MYSAAKVRQLAIAAKGNRQLAGGPVRTLGMKEISWQVLPYFAPLIGPIAGAVLSPGHRIRGAFTGLGVGFASLFLAVLVLGQTNA